MNLYSKSKLLLKKILKDFPRSFCKKKKNRLRGNEKAEENFNVERLNTKIKLRIILSYEMVFEWSPHFLSVPCD